MTRSLRFSKTLAFSLICLAALLAAGITTVLGAVSVTVSPAALNGWSFAANGGSASFSAGPGSAPLGLGSAHFTSDASGSGTAALATRQFAGTLLTDITGLSYSTYVSSASSTAVSLRLEVDFDGETTGTLVFVPPSINVTLNTWQNWSPMEFNWYADQTPDGSCTQAVPCPWGTVKGNWPLAKIAETDGEVLFQVGGAALWSSFDGNVDKFAFKNSQDDTIFDFEPPAVVYVDDSWSGVTLYADPDGTGPANALGLDAFTSLQPAVNAVQANGTIYIADGNYPASGQLVFNKTLTVTGQSKAGTVLKPLSDFTGVGDEGAWMLANPGTTLILSQVTLDGSGRQIPQALRVNGSAALDNVNLQHIRADNYMGYAVIQGNVSTSARTLTVTNSTITDFGRVGIQADAADGTSTVTLTGNTITGKGTGDYLDYGIMILGGANATITGNTITNCKGISLLGPAGSAAISVSTAADDAASSATIKANNLTGNLTAISVGFESGDRSSVNASFNRIYNNTTGAASQTTAAIAAQNNWWGCNEGPTGTDCDPVTGGVDANPWLVLNISALPSPLVPGSTFTFSADLTDNSSLADTTSLGYLPNGIQVAFAPTANVNPDSALLASGTASTLASMPVVPSSFNLCAALDGESQCREVTITQPVNTWADDDWTSLTNGTIVYWGTGDHIIGYDAFAKVQPAVDAASATGTVTVRPGTYPELVRIVGKTLKLTGESGQMAATRISVPLESVSTDSLILVSGAGVSVEITGLTISGPGTIGAGISVMDQAFANIHHNQILDIRTPTLSSTTAVGIQVGSSTQLTYATAAISSNTLSGYQKAGVVVSYTGSDATISGNTLTGAGPTDKISQTGIQVLYGATAQINSNTINRHSFLNGNGIGIQIWHAAAGTSLNTLVDNFYGISLRSTSGTHDGNSISASYSGVGQGNYQGYSIDNRPPPAPGQPVPLSDAGLAAPMPELADLAINITLSNNTLNGNVSGGSGVGVYGGYTTNNINLTVRNNYVSNWQYGLFSACYLTCATSGYPVIAAQQNSITASSTYALQIYLAPQVDARLNWWDSPTGPTHLANPGGSGGKITDGVTFSPWLCTSTDTSTDAGFQPDLSKKCGLPVKLAFTPPPGNSLATQLLSPQPVVTAQDVDGNLGINFTGAVTVAIASNPSGGTLAGTKSKNAVSGVATYTDLSINLAGTGYTLTATATGLTSATSPAFNVENPVPVLAALNPAWVRHDTPDFSLVINGSNFLNTTPVFWNGIPLTVTNRSGSTQITVLVPGAYVASVGKAEITATNPPPGGGLSNKLVFSVVDETDIRVTKTDGLANVFGGSRVTYTVVVTNAGPDPLVDGVFSDPVPTVLKDVTWSCVATGLGSNCLAIGTGNSILDTVDIAVGGTLTYTISGSLPETVSGLLSNTATLSLPASYADTDGAGLSDTDTTILGTLYLNFLPVISN